MLELEALTELARNGNARIYIGFDKHPDLPGVSHADEKNNRECVVISAMASSASQPKTRSRRRSKEAFQNLTFRIQPFATLRYPWLVSAP